MVSVGIVGASGYTGAELLRLLSRHPRTRVTTITSRSYLGQPVGACFPHLAGMDLAFDDHDDDRILDRADVFFTALPHKASMAAVPRLLDAGKVVIDLSADFRFSDPAVYEAHYGPHACPELLGEAVYGLTEAYGTAVAGARLVGNPGCYPTSVLLPVLPLLAEGLVSPDGIIADSKSGVSGAGREPGPGTHFCAVHDGLRAYKVAAHRHEPEIRTQLERASGGRPVPVVFTPHLVPMSRGILSTVYVVPEAGVGEDRVREAWQAAYGGAPFVRVLEEGALPDTAHVRGTNRCVMAVRQHPSGRLVLVSAIDNLVKGASGQAVQNLNRRMGWDEADGLDHTGLYP